MLSDQGDGDDVLDVDFKASEVLSGGLRLARLASRLFNQGPSRLDELRAQMLELELEKMRGGPLPVFARIDELVELLGPRCDHVVIGRRGGGKSALGVGLAQLYSSMFHVEPCVVGMTRRAARQVHLTPIQSVTDAPADSITLVDEAGLMSIEGSVRNRVKDLRRMLATARHAGRSFIFVAQHTASLDRELLRYEAGWWYKQVDERASLFGREEVVEHVERAAAVLRGYDGPEWTLLELGGRSFLTQNGLPAGWDEDVSKCLR